MLGKSSPILTPKAYPIGLVLESKQFVISPKFASGKSTIICWSIANSLSVSVSFVLVTAASERPQGFVPAAGAGHPLVGGEP